MPLGHSLFLLDKADAWWDKRSTADDKSMTSSQVLSVANLDIPCLRWILFPLRFKNGMVVLERESLKDLQVATEDSTKITTPCQSSGVLDVQLQSTPACFPPVREALCSGEVLNMRFILQVSM